MRRRVTSSHCHLKHESFNSWYETSFGTGHCENRSGHPNDDSFGPDQQKIRTIPRGL